MIRTTVISALALGLVLLGAPGCGGELDTGAVTGDTPPAPTPTPPACTSSGPEICNNSVDDDCDPNTPDSCIPRSCAEVLSLGIGTQSGVYDIQPASSRFQVYCDLVNDGGGWALVINAPSTGYASMPIVGGALTPAIHGQLTAARIADLLAAPVGTGNNVRVEIVSPKRVISMRAVMPAQSSPQQPDLGGGGGQRQGDEGSGESFQKLVFVTPITLVQPQVFNVPWSSNGDCSSFDKGPDLATVSVGGMGWGFKNGSQNGSTGFMDWYSRGSYGGFHTNHDTGNDLSCNRTTTPGTWQPNRAGSVWVR